MKKCLFAAAFFVLCIFGCGGEPETLEPDVISYGIFRTNEPPAIDGIMNDSCWKTADSISLVRCDNGDKAMYPTTVRAAYDSEYLYIGFECQDPDASSTITGRDGPVSDQEHISVFIDADCDERSYAVIDIAPTGAQHDAFVLFSGGNKKIMTDWNCNGIRSAVSVNGGGAGPGTPDRFWIVELALPFGEFLTSEHIPPVPGDIWRINFYRTELTNTRDISAFSPTGNEDFHIPAKFASLVFAEISE